MTINRWLDQTSAAFQTAGISSARLDAQVLLGRAMHQNRTWVLAHGDDVIPTDALAQLNDQAKRRCNREPLAYILGEREFYSRTFLVDSNVLIPRPETEQIIDTLKELNLPNDAELLDVGTGSGAIAVTAALELPQIHVSASDTSKQALATAQKNAERLGAKVYFFESDLLQHATTYTAIVANLPYVDQQWQRSPETKFEPAAALFADDGGLALINQLISQAPAHLKNGGYLLLEADPRQFDAIKNMSAERFDFVSANGFVVTLRKRQA